MKLKTTRPSLRSSDFGIDISAIEVGYFLESLPKRRSFRDCVSGLGRYLQEA
jgi:hypothetical protein